LPKSPIEPTVPAGPTLPGIVASRPLVGLLREAPDASRIVAFGQTPDQSASHARLLADVFALASHLEGDRGKRWLIESEDAYRIAVSLLAAAVAGARIALPPNLQPGTLRELRAESDRVFVDDAGKPSDARTLDPLAPGRAVANEAQSTSATSTAVETAARTGIEIDRRVALVELFTSGTSGPGKRITKALCHLEDEVAEIGELLAVAGHRGGRTASVLATVSAHHLYGLLFRVLWPLARHFAFCRQSVLLPDELLARCAETGGAVVVSSPAHLRHLAALPRAREHASAILEIISSGGPLESPTALALEDAFGRAPVEIFGSTETGGVALRRQRASDPDPCWTTFPSVTAEIDDASGALVVTSPFVTAPDSAATESQAADSPEPGTMRMGDRAEREGDGFRLAGRADRIAKVGEKTLSLPEIESFLAAHELVENAVAATYPAKSGARLGAVVVLSREGRLRLAREGRRAVQRILAAHLAERWNRVALPRRWRFVDALPVDTRGKLAQRTVEQELARPVEPPREPLLLDEQSSAGPGLLASTRGVGHLPDTRSVLVRELVVPRDLAYFDGHYDEFPLVPGAVQIHWVMLALGRIAGRRVTAERMEAVKFRNVLRPAELFTMQLAIDEAFSHVTFTLGHGSRVFSSGRITLER